MSGVSVAKKNGGQTSAIFANDIRWRPNSQILHRRDRSNSRVTETARPSGVLLIHPPLTTATSGPDSSTPTHPDQVETDRISKYVLEIKYVHEFKAARI